MAGKEGDDGPVIPYKPSHTPPREPTDEDRAMARRVLGRAMYISGDLPGAVSNLRGASDLVIDLPGLQLDLADSLYDSDDVKGALVAFELASEQDLDDETARAMAGMCQLRSGDLKAAERSFDSAIGIAPQYALPWFGKGKVLVTRGKNKRAIKYLREALRIDPRFAEARLALAQAYLVQEMRPEAAKEAWRALTLDPDDAEAQAIVEKLGASPPSTKVETPRGALDDREAMTTEPQAAPEDSEPTEEEEETPEPEEAPEEEETPEPEEAPEEILEEIPGPGRSLDKWFSAHPPPPPEG